jgi:hypothetical protein
MMRVMRRLRRPVPLVAALLLACCLAGETGRPIGSDCSRDAPCAEPLRCEYGRCRSECAFDRDCEGDATCVASADDPAARVCSLPDEGCAGEGEVCPAEMACGPDGRCHEPCSEDGTECAGDRLCLAGACVEDPDARSCRDLLEAFPLLEDGWYEIEVDASPGTFEVFCDMTAEGGGWTRIADFDAERGDPCPGEWQPLDEALLCVVDAPEGGIARSASFLSLQGLYGEVRGYVRGLQYFSTDAFDPSAEGATIDDPYVDGVSITVGLAPRRHVWTYASALREGDQTAQVCPCSGADQVPAFVGEHYFCDTGNTGMWEGVWYVESPLWDEEHGDQDMCDDPGVAPLWFTRDLGESLDEDLEVRLSTDQAHSDEDVGVYRMELYVR